MSPADLIAWFEEIAQRKITFHDKHTVKGKRGMGFTQPARFELAEASTWFTDAQSALESAFPPGHAVMKRWNAALKQVDESGPSAMDSPSLVRAAQAIFQSALAQLKAGRLKTLTQSVQAETVTELLDQANALLGGGYAVAATVITGGALETHLGHLCQQHGLSWTGSGSISKYDQAIAQHRSQTGQEVYSGADSKQVIAWGGKRNDAAHDPANFAHSDAEVRLMIDGIRQFVARTS